MIIAVQYMHCTYKDTILRSRSLPHFVLMAFSAQVDRNFLLRLFQKIDSDRNGTICANELQQALSNGSWTPFNPETVRMMIGIFDKNQNGVIDFEEFAALWQYVTDWQKTFRSYDLDNSGTIDKSELITGYRLSDKIYNMLLKKFDRSDRGSIRFDDFIQCCVVLQCKEKITPKSLLMNLEGTKKAQGSNKRGEDGKRVYTLKKTDPRGQPTVSAHPARFSPDDKYSRQRITLKRRFGLLLTQQPKQVF